jgi:hypothetical protein
MAQVSTVSNILHVHNLLKQGDADEFSSIDRMDVDHFSSTCETSQRQLDMCYKWGMNVQFTKRDMSVSQPLRWLCTREHDFDRMLNAHLL